MLTFQQILLKIITRFVGHLKLFHYYITALIAFVLHKVTLQCYELIAITIFGQVHNVNVLWSELKKSGKILSS